MSSLFFRRYAKQQAAWHQQTEMAMHVIRRTMPTKKDGINTTRG